MRCRHTHFSVDVAGTDLAADSTVDASVTTTTGDANGEATATDTEGYSVDTAPDRHHHPGCQHHGR